jgi:hypothetical protein
MARWTLLPLVGASWVALNLSSFHALAVMFFLSFSLIGFAVFRKKFWRSKTNINHQKVKAWKTGSEILKKDRAIAGPAFDV